MPNRIIKESICTSESIASLSDFQEVFFYRLIVNCDDYGRMDARPAILRARLFPLRDRLTFKDIQSALQALADAGCVELYMVDGKPYLRLPTWEVHQQIRAKKSKYPEPDCTCNQVISDDIKCPRNPIQSESESNPNPKESVPRKRFTPPAREELEQFILENGLNVDPQAFLDYYESNGWKVGNNPMKDWKAAARNWARRESARPGGGKKVPAGGAGQSPLGDLDFDSQLLRARLRDPLCQQLPVLFPVYPVRLPNLPYPRFLHNIPPRTGACCRHPPAPRTLSAAPERPAPGRRASCPQSRPVPPPPRRCGAYCPPCPSSF